ncbi:MAG: CPBP family intramembrane metalloprotease [Verrucomicrobia bacterium]|nr:CPBP family intramembrane metalloprotease [Verrucomicrobiota bacterium]
MIFELTLLLVAWILSWLFSIPLWGGGSWDWMGLVVGLTSTLPMLSLFFWLLQSSWEPCQEIRHMMDEAVLPIFKDFTIIQLALLSIAAGVSEEVLFRAVIQGGIQSALGIPVALAISAFLFGVCHALTKFYLVLATIMGVYLSLVWMSTGQLLSPIITHAVYDFIVLIWYLRLRVSPNY